MKGWNKTLSLSFPVYTIPSLWLYFRINLCALIFDRKNQISSLCVFLFSLSLSCFLVVECVIRRWILRLKVLASLQSDTYFRKFSGKFIAFHESVFWKCLHHYHFEVKRTQQIKFTIRIWKAENIFLYQFKHLSNKMCVWFIIIGTKFVPRNSYLSVCVCVLFSDSFILFSKFIKWIVKRFNRRETVRNVYA